MPPISKGSRLVSALLFCLYLALPIRALAHASPWPEGTIAGLPVPPDLLEVIDPGGHTVDPGKMDCPDCLTAFVNDGYCVRSHIGYVDGRAYVSRLSYLLAKDGERIDVNALTCSTCRAHIEEPGWCDRCGLGVVGEVAVRNRDTFREITMHWKRLNDAIRLASRCEFCAIAYFTHGNCSRCKIDYGDTPVTIASLR